MQLLKRLSNTFQKTRSPLGFFGTQRRFLNLHEFSSKELLNKFGARTQKFIIASTPEEAEKQAKKLKGELVIKAQILAGGRGKGHFDNGFKGGVHVVKDVSEIRPIAEKMLGNRLITNQTSPEGVKVKKIMIAESIDLAREVYFAILMDREAGGPVMVASPQGGMDIEQVAHSHPDAIFKEPVDIFQGPDAGSLDRLADKLLFKSDSLKKQAVQQMRSLYDLFIHLDATQVEINPMAETPTGDVYCVDAKINFDDNAQYRQEDVYKMRDVDEEDPREVSASSFNLNYIGMDGDIGCMVNGAGLAMATMDIIKLHKGSPANFLDVGGSANEKQITEAFKIIQSDPQVKGILVNIFGGIMRCDVIASGIVAAAKQIGLKLPLVVRLKGTNVDIGKKILNESGLKVSVVDDFDQAAAKAVSVSK
eukprot:TRINITY_DN2408_c0_g1_i1.p1 TRINITY_DN2408_c0_g1~~TRINITY_DN2408_c0_g1_i1.p1  ORF type:complete len:421 (-),score=105.47 TRINITY_DN2408_c0_g1_i1:37-1299(-)